MFDVYMKVTPKHMESYRVTGSMTDVLPLPAAVTPEMYLGFARSDLRRPYRRNRVNAVGNAKRGLHLHVDVVAEAFGIARLSKKNRRGFPDRLAFLTRCGLVTPAILTKLNRFRNVVEHDYAIPTMDAVLDFLDVVELFLAAGRKVRTDFPRQTHFGRSLGPSSKSRLPMCVAIGIEPSTGLVRVAECASASPDRREPMKYMLATTPAAEAFWAAATSMTVDQGDKFFDWISLVASRI